LPTRQPPIHAPTPGNEAVIADHVNRRRHQYMRASLLHSQFEILEEPSADEHPVIVPIHGSVAETVITFSRNAAAAQDAAATSQ
jgi:gluconate kinase